MPSSEGSVGLGCVASSRTEAATSWFRIVILREEVMA